MKTTTLKEIKWPQHIDKKSSQSQINQILFVKLELTNSIIITNYLKTKLKYCVKIKKNKKIKIN